MLENTPNINLQRPEITDLLTEIVIALTNNMDKIDSNAKNLQDQITENANNINNNINNIADNLDKINQNTVDIEQNKKDIGLNNSLIMHNNNLINDHIDSEEAHDTSSIVNKSNVDGDKLTDVLNALKNWIESHLNSTEAHDSQSVVYIGDITGVDNVEAAINALNSRISNIIAQSGTSDTEVVDARESAYKGRTYTTLDDRLEAIETDSKYFWEEEQTVNEGENILTIEHEINNNHKLQIIDKVYGVEWFEGIHWNRDEQNIIFTSYMPHDITFRIREI